MDFLVTAYDAPGALDRRLRHRSQHLEGARRLAQHGHLRSAGAILDADGRMIGSTLHMSFPSRDDLEAWLDVDPYTVAEVWRDVEVREIRLVDFEAPVPGSA
jgi:uncharacterized protein YciI